METRRYSSAAVNTIWTRQLRSDIRVEQTDGDVRGDRRRAVFFGNPPGIRRPTPWRASRDTSAGKSCYRARMRWIGLAWLLGLAGVASAEDAHPFPTRKSINLNTGGTFYVEGRIKIPQSITITCKKSVRIVGRGDSDAVIEVEGALDVRGALGKEVIFDNVWIEPSSTFEKIRLMDAKFTSGGVRCSRQKAARGHLIVENTEFDLGCEFDVTLRNGEINIRGAMFREAVRITGVPPPGMSHPTLKLDILGCYFRNRGPLSPKRGYSGFLGGLFVTGTNKTLVRHNRIGGSKASFVNCANLMFDGNKVDCGTLLFKQTEAGHFKKTKFLKCDLMVPEIRFEAPKAKKPDRLTMNKCWFRGHAKPKKIMKAVIRDGHTIKDSGVLVRLGKINKRPLELAGSAGN